MDTTISHSCDDSTRLLISTAELYVAGAGAVNLCFLIGCGACSIPCAPCNTRAPALIVPPLAVIIVVAEISRIDPTANELVDPIRATADVAAAA